MKAKTHATAGVIAFLTIASFWTSTVVSELFGTHSQIAMVKNAILWGMFVLVPAMALTGASGMSLGRGRFEAAVVRKKRRMPFIAGNGLLVLLPSAVFLAIKANAGDLDTSFFAVQGLELVAGALNLTMMGLNIRDGLKLREQSPPSLPGRAAHT